MVAISSLFLVEVAVIPAPLQRPRHSANTAPPPQLQATPPWGLGSSSNLLPTSKRVAQCGKASSQRLSATAGRLHHLHHHHFSAVSSIRTVIERCAPVDESCRNRRVEVLHEHVV
ncbi:hypothetical protein FHG87_013274 [Trinorchestia longiramus]|nr:hypothetical protein FHG87_013274 [Trinorchestia longiramus]